MTPQPTHCGYVVLLGAPNAGKSSLMNRLIGEPLSIVTAKAQTTWKRVTGIRTTAAHQMIFLDTPGVFRPDTKIHRAFVTATNQAAGEADVVVLVLDPTEPLDTAGRALLIEVASRSSAPRIGVVNKVDVAGEGAIRAEEEWLQEGLEGNPSIRASAESGHGIGALTGEIERLLPEGPFLYPADDIATDPVRLFAAEFVREAIFESYREEIPYACWCEVEEFREEEERTYVQVMIYVERASQKGILIGKGGAAVRDLGIRSRARLERFLDRPVYLDLWIKVLPGWRKKAAQLRELGFDPGEDGGARER